MREKLNLNVIGFSLHELAGEAHIQADFRRFRPKPFHDRVASENVMLFVPHPAVCRNILRHENIHGSRFKNDITESSNFHATLRQAHRYRDAYGA